MQSYMLVMALILTVTLQTVSSALVSGERPDAVLRSGDRPRCHPTCMLETVLDSAPSFPTFTDLDLPELGTLLSLHSPGSTNISQSHRSKASTRKVTHLKPCGSMLLASVLVLVSGAWWSWPAPGGSGPRYQPASGSPSPRSRPAPGGPGPHPVVPASTRWSQPAPGSPGLRPVVPARARRSRPAPSGP